ncbi:MAG: hypothetical protein EOO75_00805 [Myxococcales bacterium]|nr:MAG: hypothetical protein EOO75_00805 [Myxococcales bacterium]
MKQPSPLELMAFADDELDEPRASEVARWLAAHPAEAAGLDWQRDLHQATAEVGRASFGAPLDLDLSDRIMAAILAPDSERAGPAVSGMVAIGTHLTLGDREPVVGEPVTAERASERPAASAGLAASEGTTGRPASEGLAASAGRSSEARASGAVAGAAARPALAEVTPLPGPRASLTSLASRRAASRPLMVFGALLAAAAAAVIMWRSPDHSQARAPHDAPSQVTATALVASVLPADEDAVIGDDGTAITSVDFGSQSGAIFYVSGSTTASAVVWVDDSDATP